MFTHFVVLIISNCWVCYEHYHKSNALKNYMSLMEHRMNIDFTLLNYNDNISGIYRRGRPLYIPYSYEKELYLKTKTRTDVNRPIKELRLYNLGYLSRYID